MFRRLRVLERIRTRERLKTPLIDLMSQIQVIYEEIRLIQRVFRKWDSKHV